MKTVKTKLVLGPPLLVLVLLVAFGGAGIVAAPEASACDIADPFVITADHLAEADFNGPDSKLTQDYREYRRDDDATIEITGVYVYESVYFVDGDEDWYAGSLSVPMQIWGEWPDDTTPEAIEPRRRDAEVPSCGWGPLGRLLGRRVYSVVGADNVNLAMDQEAEAVLTASFGVPDIAPRDASVENDLIAQIDAARRSTTRLFIGGGLAAIAIAGIVMYMSRSNPETVTES